MHEIRYSLFGSDKNQVYARGWLGSRCRIVGAMPCRSLFKQIQFKVVQSVFDEETATEVIKSYLKLIRDADLPEESKLTFKQCQFDSDSGMSELLLTLY